MLNGKNQRYAQKKPKILQRNMDLHLELASFKRRNNKMELIANYFIDQYQVTLFVFNKFVNNNCELPVSTNQTCYFACR